MSYYRVVGYAESETKNTGKQINKVVFAFSEKDATEVALMGYPFQPSWVETPDVRAATRLEALEQQALEEWNAQLPTASPLALAQARGEL